MRKPPGKIIYSHTQDLAVFEVDGAVETEYCQNLCVFARRFLEHKTVHDRVQPFMFYILAAKCTSEQVNAGNLMEVAEPIGLSLNADHIIKKDNKTQDESAVIGQTTNTACECDHLDYSEPLGFPFSSDTVKTDLVDHHTGEFAETDRSVWFMTSYFSRMKTNSEHNLSCLVVYPAYSGLSFGKMLIDLSYKMSAVDGIIGTPERPLTDAGLGAYRNYWTEKLFEYLLRSRGNTNVSILGMSETLRIHQFDIIDTLLFHGLVKNYRGDHIILKSLDAMNDFVEKRKHNHIFDWNVRSHCLHYESKLTNEPSSFAVSARMNPRRISHGRTCGHSISRSTKRGKFGTAKRRPKKNRFE